jgi:hypothetical protein
MNNYTEMDPDFYDEEQPHNINMLISNLAIG